MRCTSWRQPGGQHDHDLPRKADRRRPRRSHPPANEIAGREWGSYEREFDALEERAGELKGYGLLTADKEVACEIRSLDTASKRPGNSSA